MVTIIRVLVLAATALGLAACDGGSSLPPAPTVTLTSSVSGVVEPGTLVTLSWSTTHATSCVASGAWRPSAVNRRVGGRLGFADVYIHDLVLGSRWRGDLERHDHGVGRSQHTQRCA